MLTNTGFVSAADGDRCPDGQTGKLRVFLWETNDGVARQRELADPADHGIAPEPLVPPGDCAIIEFTADEKPRTDYLCEQYEVAERTGRLKIDHDGI